jgi:hypothetical protein
MSFFIVPIEGSGIRHDARRPKYVPALGVAWAMVDFGDTAIVWANSTSAQEAIVGANSDAFVVPPADNAVSVSATKSALEALSVPAQWVTAGMTYRMVLRVVVGMAQLVQYVRDALGQTSLVVAGHLDDTFNSLPIGVRGALTQAAVAFGVDTSGLSGASTLRQILFNFGQQCAAGLIQIRLGDV